MSLTVQSSTFHTDALGRHAIITLSDGSQLSTFVDRPSEACHPLEVTLSGLFSELNKIERQLDTFTTYIDQANKEIDSAKPQYKKTVRAHWSLLDTYQQSHDNRTRRMDWINKIIPILKKAVDELS